MATNHVWNVHGDRYPVVVLIKIAIMQNFHVLKIIAMGPTNTLPARVKIVSERFDESVVLNYGQDLNSNTPSLERSERWLKENGFNIIGKGEGIGHYYVITDTFEPLKK